MNSSLKLSPMRNMLEEKYTIVTAKSAPFLMPFNETSKSTANLWSTISKTATTATTMRRMQITPTTEPITSAVASFHSVRSRRLVDVTEKPKKCGHPYPAVRSTAARAVSVKLSEP